MFVRNLTKTAFLKLLPVIVKSTRWLRHMKTGPQSDGKVPILVYHKITDLRQGVDAQWSISPAVFAEQMAYLKAEKFDVLSLSDFCSRLHQGKAMPPKPILITFDDGYADMYRHAYPVLKAFGFPATVFIAVDYAEKHRFFPWDRTVLDRMPQHYESMRLLAWDEMREMQSSGVVSFGSHTMTHPHLGRLAEEKIEYELAASKAVLEKRLGRPVDLFAYPGGIPRYGDLSQKTRQILSRCGYKLACTSVFGRNGIGENPYLLKRIGIQSTDTLSVFSAKITGGCDWIETAQSAFQQVFNTVF